MRTSYSVMSAMCCCMECMCCCCCDTLTFVVQTDNWMISSRYIIRIKNATHTEVIFQELSLKNVLPQINKVKGDQK